MMTIDKLGVKIPRDKLKSVKLSIEEKNELITYRNSGHSLNDTARKFGVSKKLVLLYTNKTSLEKAKETRKLYQLDGRLKKYYLGDEREKQTKRVADWRERRKAILLKTN